MQPVPNRTMLLSVTTASQAWPLPGPGPVTFQNLGGGQVAYVAFGNSNGVVTAVPSAHANNVTEANYSVLGGFPILANAPVVPLTSPAGATHFAAIGSAALSLVVSALGRP